jgi:hypothetical protein
VDERNGLSQRILRDGGDKVQFDATVITVPIRLSSTS